MSDKLKAVENEMKEMKNKVKIVPPAPSPEKLFRDLKANECFKLLDSAGAGWMKVDVPGYPNAVINLYYGTVELDLFDDSVNDPVIPLEHEVHIQDV